MDEYQKAALDKKLKLQRGAAIIEGTQGKYREDGYTNVLNKYGTSQDNSTAYQYAQEPFADDMQLIRLYEGNGLFAKIIDRPAEEAVKHGLDIDFGNNEVSDYVARRLDELEYEDKFATAEKWSRLYGGSIIVMLCDDGGGLEDPLDWDNVRSIEELRVFERAVVQPDYSALYNFNFNEGYDKDRPFGEPEYYSIFSIYGYFIVHRSRCLVFRNGRLPEQTTNALYRYFGIPEYVKLRTALRECLTSHQDGVKLLDRSVQAIYKMKGLSSLLSTDAGEDNVLKRLQVIDMARGILNSIAIDNDGEDYTFQTMPLSGVKDVIDSTCNMLSAVTNIPQTILFGRSPAGMNSTGDSDMENFYNMVENIQKRNMKANTRTLVDLILRQGVIEGNIDSAPEYKVQFTPLWSLSEQEQANVDKTKAETEQVKAATAQLYMDASVVDPSEVRRTLAKDGDFQIEDIVTEDTVDDIDIPEDTFDLGENPMGVPDGQPVDDKPDPANTDSEAPLPEEETEAKAAAVLIVKDGRILCGTRLDNGLKCGPGGHVEEGEDTKTAAIRETLEEFNITPLNLIPLGVVSSSTGLSLPSMVYITDEYEGTVETDGTEMVAPRWMTLEELSREKLFEPFEESIKKLTSLLTGDDDPATITAEDGGPGSGRYPKGSGKLSSSEKNRIKKRIIGYTTSEGTKIKRISNHAFDRIGGRKISPGRIEKTLSSTIKEPGHSPDTTKHYYNNGAAIVNNKTGTLVTYMWTGGK